MADRLISNPSHRHQEHANMAHKIYIVVLKDMTLRRLVRANNRVQALRHVAADTLGVALASQDQLIDLVSAGAKIEDSTASTDDSEV